MTITIKCKCDECHKEISEALGNNYAMFTVYSIIAGIKLEVHFCNIDCFKKYMTEHWETEAIYDQ